MSKVHLCVTKPVPPLLKESPPYQQQICDNNILTNGESVHQQLARALGEYPRVKDHSLFANNTIGLVTALQVLTHQWRGGHDPIFLRYEG